MKSLVTYISVTLFIGILLFELLIATLSRKFRMPPIIIKIASYFAS